MRDMGSVTLMDFGVSHIYWREASYVIQGSPEGFTFVFVYVKRFVIRDCAA